jgi:hypothetical protein
VKNFHTSDLFEMGIEYVHEIPESVLRLIKIIRKKRLRIPLNRCRASSKAVD